MAKARGAPVGNRRARRRVGRHGRSPFASGAMAVAR